jgi:hypothetical protein
MMDKYIPNDYSTPDSKVLFVSIAAHAIEITELLKGSPRFCEQDFNKIASMHTRIGCGYVEIAHYESAIASHDNALLIYKKTILKIKIFLLYIAIS